MRSEEVVLSFSLLLLSVPLLCFQICSGVDTLKGTQSITDSGKLVSSNATFELGFFSPPGVKSGEKKYLGIWYHKLEPQTVVWVANRDDPVADSSGVFRIAEDGNVVVEYASKSLWSSKLEPSSSTNRTLKLLDSGNLVLTDDSETRCLWESFKNPTDTFLLGMKMDATLSLTCWRDPADPAPGSFTFKMGHRETLVVENQSQLYWTESLDGSGTKISGFLGSDTSLLKNSSNLSCLSSKPHNKKERLLMNSSGEIQLLKWDEDDKQWDKKSSEPASMCDVYDHCGSFGICDANNLNFLTCKCLPGFRPRDEEIRGQGCVRKSTSCTIDTNVTFLNLTNIKVRDPDEMHGSETEADCESLCRNITITKCPQSQCQAYSYSSRAEFGRDDGNSTCKIWRGNLSTLVVNGIGGRNLSVLFKRSDIEATAKSCDPCGTYEIPYPLSTGPNCGDPTYNKFNCNELTGNLTFTMPGGNSYEVTWIDEDKRVFYIKVDDSYSCGSRNQNKTPKLPFSLAEPECSKIDGMIKMKWAAAPEPPCRKPPDCENWPHSTCMVTSDGGHRCLCDSHYKWNPTVMICAKG